MSETGPCSRWVYEGKVEQWAKEEVERELAEMTVSLKQLAGLEERRRRKAGLRFMAQRPVCAGIIR